MEAAHRRPEGRDRHVPDVGGFGLTGQVNLTTGPLVCPCYIETQGWFTSQGSQRWKEGSVSPETQWQGRDRAKDKE